MKDTYLLGIDYLIDVMKGKYKTTIVCLLGEKKQHFGELFRKANLGHNNQVTKKVLSRQLKELIKEGIIERQVINTMPPQTLYSLTDTGQQIRKLMIKLSLFGEQLVKKNTPGIDIKYSYDCVIKPKSYIDKAITASKKDLHE